MERGASIGRARLRARCEIRSDGTECQAPGSVSLGVSRWIPGSVLHAGWTCPAISVRRKTEGPPRAARHPLRSSRQSAATPALRWIGTLHRGNVRDRQTSLSGGADASDHGRLVLPVRLAPAKEANRDSGIEGCLPLAEAYIFSAGLKSGLPGGSVGVGARVT